MTLPVTGRPVVQRKWVMLVTICLVAASPLALMEVAKASPRINLLIEPTYIACLAGSSCSSVGRLSLTVRYRPIITQTQVLKFELSRKYVRSEDEADQSIDVIGGRSYLAATDQLLGKLTNYPQGYERNAWQLSYSYQHSIGGSTSFHTGFGGYSFMFGRPIQRGSIGPGHTFEVLLQASRNIYQSSTLPPQDFFLVNPSATFPLNAAGTWRALASYTVQQRFAGSGRLSPYASLASARLTRDFNPSIKAWVRVDWRTLTAPTVQQMTTATFGIEFKL